MKTRFFLLWIVNFLVSVTFLPASEGEQTPAAEIDEFIEAALAEKGLKPNSEISDEVFLKRIYLEIAGRLPSALEARNFLDSRAAGKRDRLIDDLLASDDFAHHFFNYWADILRVRVNRGGSAGGYADFANWLMTALRENRPYDEMVRGIVTAQGPIAENGASTYTRRDFAMPLDNMASTVRVFLGIRLECAQCHDDPFDDWTQRDFYRMASYSYGFKQMSSRRDGTMGAVSERLRKEFFDPSITDRSGEYNRLHRTWNAVTAPWAAGHANGSRFIGGHLKLPHDYQYDDAEPETVVEALTIFGDPPELDDDPKRKIDRYAEWMTSSENEAFTKVIVNRLWERVFGVRLHASGVTERVDDMALDSESLHPDLFEYLCRRMISLDYDLRGFLAILYKSRSYQRAATTVDPPGDIREYAFQGPQLKRASAEQIWDSLVGLINPRPNHGYWVNRVTLEVRRQTLNELHRALRNWDEEKFFQAILKIREEMKREQVLIDERTAQITRDHKGSDRELADKLKALKGNGEFVGQNGFIYRHVYEPALADAGERERFFIRLPSDLGELEVRADWKTIASKPTEAFREEIVRIQGIFMEEELKRHGITDRGQQNAYRKFRGLASQVCRASDIDLPAPPGHFLRKFGQADRQLIENSTREASLIQPLALMNERTIDLLRSPFSPLSLALAETEDMEGKIETAYLSLLARRPTSKEWGILKEEAARRGQGFEQDLVAALLNTGEFLFIR